MLVRMRSRKGQRRGGGGRSYKRAGEGRGGGGGGHARVHLLLQLALVCWAGAVDSVLPPGLPPSEHTRPHVLRGGVEVSLLAAPEARQAALARRRAACPPARTAERTNERTNERPRRRKVGAIAGLKPEGPTPKWTDADAGASNWVGGEALALARYPAPCAHRVVLVVPVKEENGACVGRRACKMCAFPQTIDLARAAGNALPTPLRPCPDVGRGGGRGVHCLASKAAKALDICENHLLDFT